MPTHQTAALTEREELDRFEALDGRAQPPPAGTPGPSVDAAGTHRDPPGLGRSIIISSTAAITFVLITVTAGLMVTGTSFASSLGLGAFSALWGGGGFGAMIGGVLYAHRLEQTAPVASPVGSVEDLSPALLPLWPSKAPGPGAR